MEAQLQSKEFRSREVCTALGTPKQETHDPRFSVVPRPGSGPFVVVASDAHIPGSRLLHQQRLSSGDSGQDRALLGSAEGPAAIHGLEKIAILKHGIQPDSASSKTGLPFPYDVTSTLAKTSLSTRDLTLASVRSVLHCSRCQRWASSTTMVDNSQIPYGDEHRSCSAQA
ncbi:hypothetical protein CONLIGDRAFT_630683 [Coniochaeta ligniaria NRRL 30616]|uniref:Uncharacterized protein n=1 Tax=Coniochaeta ligniaria NRRL 30616 TaxID=1408157 RepID=A0A1J7IU89_9PEZI|nr:hypothetical protein CONLIGDRAFT_630683 [Coniochaeta ligniaria NRRL 30616]